MSKCGGGLNQPSPPQTRCGSTLFQSSHGWARITLFNLGVTCVTYLDSLVPDKSHKLCDSFFIYIRTMQIGRLGCIQYTKEKACMLHKNWEMPFAWALMSCGHIQIASFSVYEIGWQVGKLEISRVVETYTYLGDGMGWDMWRCFKWWAHL